MNLSKRVFHLIVFLMIGGCAAIPPEKYLGTKSEVSTGAISEERLPQAVSMRFPGLVEDIDGYAVSIPPDRQQEENVCLKFSDAVGKEVEVCRKTSRVFIDGVERSAFIHGGTWYVFVPKGKVVSAMQFPTPNGKEILTVSGREAKKLNAEEIPRVYERIMQTFPYTSKPIGGVAVLFGKETIAMLKVPSLTIFEERWGRCGGLSFSSTEAAALATGSPLAAVPKGLAGICSLVTHPNFLMKVVEKPQPEGDAFIGDK